MNPPVVIMVPLLALSLAAVLLVLYLLYHYFEWLFAGFLGLHALGGSLDDPCLEGLRRVVQDDEEPENQNSPEPENP